MRTPDIFDTKPCTDAVEWLKTQPDLKTAWNNCERGDWMWWALMHSDTELPQSTCVEFANDCAGRAKKYAANAAAWAADAAYAAADAADAAYAAWAAANAAANAAAWAAANAAAWAAAWAAADAAAYAAERKLQAEWIRKNIPCPFEE